MKVSCHLRLIFGKTDGTIRDWQRNSWALIHRPGRGHPAGMTGRASDSPPTIDVASPNILPIIIRVRSQPCSTPATAVRPRLDWLPKVN